ncbi:MAG: hypothetical protein RLZZ292_1849 [Bacteroidota bacterium]|jgi:hypothetical protein
MTKSKITIEKLIEEAKNFCILESKFQNTTLFGVTDGKAVGTFIEQKFKFFLSQRYEIQLGNAASGIDLPSTDINTDIKVTSIKQPQSSCPFKDAKQKIYGLGYNLLVFVYDKQDEPNKKIATLNFVSCSFVHAAQTADYQTTFALRQMLSNNANEEEIIAYLMDKNLPADEIGLTQLAKTILATPPKQGYLTISNALQWRLQYGRIVTMSETVEGITRIINNTTN